MIEGLLKTLKRLANKRMELSLLDIKEYDDDYNKAMSRVVELEKQYDIMDLKQEERIIIEKLKDAMDDVEVEQSNLSYLAGFIDGVMILEVLDLLRQ